MQRQVEVQTCEGTEYGELLGWIEKYSKQLNTGNMEFSNVGGIEKLLLFQKFWLCGEASSGALTPSCLQIPELMKESLFRDPLQQVHLNWNSTSILYWVRPEKPQTPLTEASEAETPLSGEFIHEIRHSGWNALEQEKKTPMLQEWFIKTYLMDKQDSQGATWTFDVLPKCWRC